MPGLASPIFYSVHQGSPCPGCKCFYAGIFRGGNLQRLALSMEPRPSISLSLDFSRPTSQSAETWICEPHPNYCFQRFPDSVDVRCKMPLTGFLSNSPRNKPGLGSWLVLVLASLCLTWKSTARNFDANTPQ